MRDAKIGKKEYLIGKQTLLDGNRAVVVDWRKAELSSGFSTITNRVKSTGDDPGESRKVSLFGRTRSASAEGFFTG
jgi:hypothetical protein